MTAHYQAAEHDATVRPATGRPVIFATEGIISSGHYLTSMAGMRMLLSGGNAFDAIVAAGFAAAVIEPTASYSLGAEGVFMLHDARSGDILSLSGQGVAPRAATVDFFRSKGLETIPTGPGPQASLSFTVPGIVDAYISLLERYGTKRLGEVLAPAIQYAEHGIPHYEYMLKSLDSDAIREQFEHYPGGRDVFFPDGALPSPGTPLVQKGFARTLRRMVEAENDGPSDRLAGLRAARESFYDGDLAETIVGCVQEVDGILGRDDLAGYRAQYEEPLRTTYVGYEVCGQRTWSQSAVLMQALNMLETMDLAAMGHNSPEYVHAVVEVLKLALADREAYYGDPDFAEVPVDGLLSKAYSAERVKAVYSGLAHPELPPPGDPWRYSSMRPTATAASVPAGGSDGDSHGTEDGTTHIAVLDREGNMVCTTPSGGSLSKSVYFSELGFTLSTRSEMFNFQDGHPNVLVPGKRPRTTLVNYLMLKDGQPVFTIGCPGGDYQTQACLQLILNTVVFGMNPQEAIEAPRFATDSVTNSFHPHVYFPGQMSLEPAIGEETAEALRALGHKVERAQVCGMGATVARRDPVTGVLSTGSDPRRACYAIGW